MGLFGAKYFFLYKTVISNHALWYLNMGRIIFVNIFIAGVVRDTILTNIKSNCFKISMQHDMEEVFT